MMNMFDNQVMQKNSLSIFLSSPPFTESVYRPLQLITHLTQDNLQILVTGTEYHAPESWQAGPVHYWHFYGSPSRAVMQCVDTVQGCTVMYTSTVSWGCQPGQARRESVAGQSATTNRRNRFRLIQQLQRRERFKQTKTFSSQSE